MDMTFEEVLEFAEKHPPPKGGLILDLILDGWV